VLSFVEGGSAEGKLHRQPGKANGEMARYANSVDQTIVRDSRLVNSA
jgi:hypothetical protein